MKLFALNAESRGMKLVELLGRVRCAVRIVGSQPLRGGTSVRDRSPDGGKDAVVFGSAYVPGVPRHLRDAFILF